MSKTVEYQSQIVWLCYINSEPYTTSHKYRCLSEEGIPGSITVANLEERSHKKD